MTNTETLLWAKNIIKWLKFVFLGVYKEGGAFEPVANLPEAVT